MQNLLLCDCISKSELLFKDMYTKKTSLDIEKMEQKSVISFPFFSHIQANLETEVNAAILYILHLPRRSVETYTFRVLEAGILKAISTL